jgi:DNA-binding transcriptional MerR regulator
VADRAYLSIGEVLSLLKEEFPDVTISKIRFLESQGLLDPERTPSGYRKFYAADVERLRWILRQQRENFLPLKVIRGKLGEEELGEVAGDAPAPAIGDGNGARAPAPAASAVAPAWPEDTGPSGPYPGATGASTTLEELCGGTGLRPDQVRELERYGLLAGRSVAGTVYYDEDANVVAGLAASFRRFGVEARHLRMYKSAAEREAGFFEQVVMPLLKQRNPEARRQAGETLAELVRLGESLRAAMLRLALRDYPGA